MKMKWNDWMTYADILVVVGAIAWGAYGIWNKLFVTEWLGQWATYVYYAVGIAGIGVAAKKWFMR